MFSFVGVEMVIGMFNDRYAAFFTRIDSSNERKKQYSEVVMGMKYYSSHFRRANTAR